ncbi:hypothetical protein [Mycobacteroides abscessus]|uniref:hypothetical protein n=1 Tax=Mycobacteroides abscessus TaxID=36809 RepID=UPI0019CF9996|nr:hypothetical protein [Mycobacteroides abscessus]QSN49623.1 hypothetical protein I3U33_26465 [Mycobacteroides abscessus subsp. abscessus]
MGTSDAEYIQQGIDEAETYKRTAYEHAQGYFEAARIQTETPYPKFPAMPEGSMFGDAVGAFNRKRDAVSTAEHALRCRLVDEAHRLGVEPPADLRHLLSNEDEDS